jgi:hypothetical protein
MANVHTKTQQEFIVRKLAAFEPPRSIVLDFAAVFPDTKCDENDVRRLDPSNGGSPDLFAIFKRTREAVLLDPESAPFAAQQARLVALSNHAKLYNGNNQLAEARAVMRQIAEELGVVGQGKTAKGAAPAAGEDSKKLVAITRTVVDPVPPETPEAPAS